MDRRIFARLRVLHGRDAVIVDGSGAATGIAVGEAVIQVLFRGKTATRQLEVVP